MGSWKAEPDGEVWEKETKRRLRLLKKEENPGEEKSLGGEKEEKGLSSRQKEHENQDKKEHRKESRRKTVQETDTGG